MRTPFNVVWRVAMPLYLATTVLALLFMAAGCQDFGLERPQSFDQKLAYAYGTHTAVLESATTALEAKRITVEDARQVLEMADQTRLLLDGARLASAGGDYSTAENRLALAVSVLIQLQDYLNRGGPIP